MGVPSPTARTRMSGQVTLLCARTAASLLSVVRDHHFHHGCASVVRGQPAHGGASVVRGLCVRSTVRECLGCARAFCPSLGLCASG
jgi:hypothetical protein